MTDVDIHDDVPARVANSALVANAGNTAYETREVVPVDLTGATGVMLLIYNATGSEAELAAMVPTLASVNATDAGRVWVANGAYYEDKLVKVVLLGSGAPTAGDGWDGAYWLDTATNVEYGPKALGVWDTTNAGKGVQTKAEIATLPWVVHTTATSVAPLVAPAEEVLAFTGTSRSVGTWGAPVANGQPVPEDGTYRMSGTFSGLNSSGVLASMELKVFIDGALYSGLPQRTAHDAAAGGWFTVPFDSGPIALTAGQVMGLDLKVNTGNCFLGGYGVLEIRKLY